MEEIESEGSDIVSDGDTEADEYNADDYDDEDMDLDDFQFHGRWTTNHSEFIRRNAFSFNQGEAGAHVQHPKEARPIHYFNLLWGDSLWTHIVDETNRYANQELSREPVWDDNGLRWTNIDKSTIKAYIGLIFCMGILRLPSRNDYWRVKKRLFRTNFSKVMPRDRFNLIWRYFHLQDNESRPNTEDKLRKIRFFLDYLNDKFAEAYTPYGNYTVDESMIKFKGRLSFRQYMPAKPIKWGVKVWTLAESETGYIYHFQVYTGKPRNGTRPKGLGHGVVTDLVRPLYYKHVKVFMDNFFTSTSLLTELYEASVYACGTIRANARNIPQELLPKNIQLEKHQYRVAQNNQLTFAVWQDTKPVLCLSNYHDPTSIGNVNRRAGKAEQIPVRTPQIFADYQKYMRGCFFFFFFYLSAVTVCNCLVLVLLHFVNLYVCSSLSEDGTTVPTAHSPNQAQKWAVYQTLVFRNMSPVCPFRQHGFLVSLYKF